MEKNKNIRRGRFKYRLVYTSGSMVAVQEERGYRTGQRGLEQRESPFRSPVFDWLVRYHTQENLLAYIDYLSSSVEVKPVANGRENSSTTGCLILENGDTLVSKLRQERIILDYQSPQFQPATTYQQFAEFLEHHKGNDGAFFYDGKHQQLARVARYTNNNPAIEAVRERQVSLIPADFFFYRQDAAASPLTEQDLDEHSGTKTDLAMVLPVAYTSPGCRVHAYQIKRTAYAGSGLGKVTHFGPQGLEEEFFFKDHSGEGPLVLPGFPLVGVYRLYEARDGQVERILEKVVNVGRFGRVGEGERKVA